MHLALSDIKKVKRKIFTYLGQFVLVIEMMDGFEVTCNTSQKHEAELVFRDGFMRIKEIV